MGYSERCRKPDEIGVMIIFSWVGLIKGAKPTFIDVEKSIFATKFEIRSALHQFAPIKTVK